MNSNPSPVSVTTYFYSAETFHKPAGGKNCRQHWDRMWMQGEGTAEEIYGFCLQSFTCIDVQEKKNPLTISFQDQLVELTVRKRSFASKLSIFVPEIH